MLSFNKVHDKSIPIVKILKQKNNKGGNNIIYYTHPMYKDEIKNIDNDPMNYDFAKLLKNKKFKHLKPKDIYRIRNLFLKNKVSLKGGQEMDNIRDQMNNDMKKDIKIKGNHEFIHIPQKQLRCIYYIAGPSGCGKSTMSSKLIKNLLKKNKDKRAFLFSVKDEDAVLDKIDQLKRVELDEEILEEPIELDELRNSIAVFDDADVFRDKRMSKEVNYLKDLICQVGRSYDIDAIITAHELTNYKKTKVLFDELHVMIIFPADTNYHSLRYVLREYFGMTRDQIRRLMQLPTDYVMVVKKPRMIIYRNGCYLL